MPEFERFASRFFPQETMPITAAGIGTFPDCPQLADTRLGALLVAVARDARLRDSYNRLLTGDRVADEDGVVVFCEENQNTIYWGVASGAIAQPSPPVLRTENVDPPQWEVEFDTLDGFLILFCAWQAMNGAWDFHGFGKSKDAARKISAAGGEPIDLGPNTTGLAVYACGDDTLFAVADGEVFAASRIEEEWKAVRRIFPSMRALHAE